MSHLLTSHYSYLLTSHYSHLLTSHYSLTALVVDPPCTCPLPSCPPSRPLPVMLPPWLSCCPPAYHAAPLAWPVASTHLLHDPISLADPQEVTDLLARHRPVLVLVQGLIRGTHQALLQQHAEAHTARFRPCCSSMLRHAHTRNTSGPAAAACRGTHTHTHTHARTPHTHATHTHTCCPPPAVALGAGSGSTRCGSRSRSTSCGSSSSSTGKQTLQPATRIHEWIHITHSTQEYVALST